ncbi:MAG TPA: oligosaccharide flippase family protein, partial [Polyangia bacterium]
MSDPNNSPAAQKAQDLAHAARSGGMQVLTILSQAILPLTHVVVARLFGTVVFGAYQNSLAVIEMATRGGTGGADKAMLRYVAGFRGRGDEAGVESAIGTGLRQCFGIAGPLVLFLMLGAPLLARLLHEPELAISLPAMAPAVLLTGLMVSLVQASLAARVTRANFIVRGLGEPSFLFLAGVLAALLGRTLGHLAIAHSLAALATCALAVVMVGRVFGQGQLRR